MKKCSLCGENTTSWGKNIPCQPADAPLWEDHLPDQPGLSAIARGFAPGDVVRNSRGHVGIVTYANHKWGDIRVRLRGKCAEEYPTTAMGWRVVKKASPEQAQRWLAEEALRAKDEFHFRRYFRIDPVTNETVYIHDEDSFFTKKTEWKTSLCDTVNKVFMEKIMDDMLNNSMIFIKKFDNLDKNNYLVIKGKDGGIYRN